MRPLPGAGVTPGPVAAVATSRLQLRDVRPPRRSPEPGSASDVTIGGAPVSRAVHPVLLFDSLWAARHAAVVTAAVASPFV
jgi:hypothetical protein